MSVATIPFHSPEYPAALKDLSDAPHTLWALGRLDTLRDPIVAIVGTRRATSYGLRMAREISSALARAGACIVSGMAFGIDGAAHQGALDVGGRTVAVLGGAVDVPQPRGHLAIYRAIVETGLVLSETPVGDTARKWTFLERNRLIAALARLVIVVEAPEKSGALNTANHALELGREIAVVPGQVDAPQCEGSNKLMRTGAHPIIDVDDALLLAGLAPRPKKTALAIEDETERQVWKVLAKGAATMDELCARSSLPVAQCMAAVTGLELRGVVECALTGEIRRR